MPGGSCQKGLEASAETKDALGDDRTGMGLDPVVPSILERKKGKGNPCILDLGVRQIGKDPAGAYRTGGQDDLDRLPGLGSRQVGWIEIRSTTAGLEIEPPVINGCHAGDLEKYLGAKLEGRDS